VTTIIIVDYRNVQIGLKKTKLAAHYCLKKIFFVVFQSLVFSGFRLFHYRTVVVEVRRCTQHYVKY